MSRGAEILGATLWAATGAAIVIASWRMDRLDKLGINPWSAPGLTPGIIGALIVVFAFVLLWRSLRVTEEPQAEPRVDTAGEGAPVHPAGSSRRTLAAALLCVLFAGASLGHGWPFAVEGALFILVFTAAFSWVAWRSQRRIGRGLAQTLVVAVLASTFVSWLFESVFLVRLP